VVLNVTSDRRRRNCGFTLVELVVVVAIIAIIMAILIPNLIESLNKGKQKRTMADIRQIGTAMLMWYTDALGAAAAGQPVAQNLDFSVLTPVTYANLKQILVTGGPDPANPLPMYIQAIPEVDAWGTPFEFGIAENLENELVLGIRSAGSNRLTGSVAVFEGPVYEIGSYLAFHSECDIVWVDGTFRFFPEGAQAVGANEAGVGTCK